MYSVHSSLYNNLRPLNYFYFYNNIMLFENVLIYFYMVYGINNDNDMRIISEFHSFTTLHARILYTSMRLRIFVLSYFVL